MVLRDDQRERIAPLLPGKVGDPGRSAADNRLFWEAVLWIVRVGSPWRDLPEAFGNWNLTLPRLGGSCALCVDQAARRVRLRSRSRLALPYI